MTAKKKQSRIERWRQRVNPVTAEIVRACRLVALRKGLPCIITPDEVMRMVRLSKRKVRR